MKSKRSSAQYLARARAFSEAVDLGVELSAALPANEREAMVKSTLEWKEMALAPRPGLATNRSLAYLEQAFFTYWNEASGKHVDRFWRLVAERGLPFERKDAVRDVLVRGRIKTELEYELITDAMGKISLAEKKKLSEMLAEFEKRATAPRGPRMPKGPRSR